MIPQDTLTIWHFRDDMLETGCEMNPEKLKKWLMQMADYKNNFTFLFNEVFNKNKNDKNKKLIKYLLTNIKCSAEYNKILSNYLF